MSIAFEDLDQELQDRLMEGRPLLNGGWLHCDNDGHWYWESQPPSEHLEQVGELTQADVDAIEKNNWEKICRRLNLPLPATYHLILEDRKSPEQVILGGKSISDLTEKLEKLNRKFPKWIVQLLEIGQDGWWIPHKPPKIWQKRFSIAA